MMRRMRMPMKMRMTRMMRRMRIPMKMRMKRTPAQSMSEVRL